MLFTERKHKPGEIMNTKECKAKTDTCKDCYLRKLRATYPKVKLNLDCENWPKPVRQSKGGK